MQVLNLLVPSCLAASLSNPVVTEDAYSITINKAALLKEIVPIAGGPSPRIIHEVVVKAGGDRSVLLTLTVNTVPSLDPIKVAKTIHDDEYQFPLLSDSNDQDLLNEFSSPVWIPKVTAEEEAAKKRHEKEKEEAYWDAVACTRANGYSGWN